MMNAVNNSITAHTGQSTTYGRGLYTLYSGRLDAEHRIEINSKWEWHPCVIVWVGIRATDRGARYYIKDNKNKNWGCITDFRIGAESLKKYLNIKKEAT